MDYIGLFVGIGSLVLAPLALELASSYVLDWIAYYYTGEYNLDGDIDTPDWCEMFNIGTGEWFLAKILSYSKPITIGGGGVRFETVDENGERHLHFHPLSEWRSPQSRTRRRRVSIEQERRICEAGNNWPCRAKPLEKAIPVDVKARESIQELTALQVSLAGRIEDVRSMLEEFRAKRPMKLSTMVERVEKAVDEACSALEEKIMNRLIEAGLLK